MSRDKSQYNWSPLAITTTPVVLPKAEQERIIAERPPEVQRLLENVQTAQKPVWSPAQMRRLANKLNISQDWRERAACRGLDADRFFPEKHGTAIGNQAKQVCKGCRVRQACLNYALEVGEKHGIWGGLSERQRRPLHSAQAQRESA